MCGRYSLLGPISRLTAYFDLKEFPDFAPRYNIAPGGDVLVIRQRPGLGRSAQFAHWGLIPAWAKDPSIGRKLNNARAESLAEKAAFRTGFARHRCLIPASGFFEWQPAGDASPVRQPYFVRPCRDGDYFALAGILARWKSAHDEDIVSACIITTAANPLIAPIHDRMPVVLRRRDIDAWLDPGNQDLATLGAMLQPAPPDEMIAYPVSTAVNQAAVDRADLIEPLPAGKAPPT